MEDFVTFELAKKLKEKGFNWKVNAYYGKHENIFDVHPAMDMNDCEYRCSSPTISQVLKWLREEKGLHIEIRYTFSEETLWDFEVLRIGSYKGWLNNRLPLNSYEEAALAGIDYVLDNLI